MSALTFHSHLIISVPDCLIVMSDSITIYVGTLTEQLSIRKILKGKNFYGLLAKCQIFPVNKLCYMVFLHHT